MSTHPSPEFKSTEIFHRNYNSTARIVINRGGTRSSKTYSLAQIFILELFSGENKTLSVVRKSFPSLRSSAMRDVMEILHTYELYQFLEHNKTEHTLRFGSNVLEFFSLDNEQKVRGRKRSHLWLNEANECSYAEWQQLIFRTTGKAYLDFNPDDAGCWINTELEQTRAAAKGDVEVIVSTYRDNSFLDATTVAEIEYLKISDPEYWKVFGEGEYGRISGQVFKEFKVVPQLPEEGKCLALGLDFGFTNDPTALVEVRQAHGELYLHEHIYETGLTNTDIAARLKTMELPPGTEIIADAAEPKSIEEIYRAGINIKPALKGPDSVNLSIDILRRFSLNITAESVNLIKELRSYKWQTDKEGHRINKPIDFNNHAIDAVRYVALNRLKAPRQGKYMIK